MSALKKPADANSTKAGSKKANKGNAITQPTTTTKQQKQAAKAAKAETKALDSAKKSPPESASPSKKHPTKPQGFKITRDKERKEKQLKQSASIVDASTSASTSASTTTATASTLTQRLQEMEQDSVKSRNHKLFLAPALRHSSPCWSGRQPRDLRTESVAERLHEEIIEYTKHTLATVDAMAVHIEEMIAHVDRCVHSLWPTSRMEPFGSYSTGIWLPSSDVDLVILGVVEIHDRMLTIKSLRQLAQALESKPWVESIVVLDTAKIPVLKLVTAESSVPIDITFESTATHSGLLARDLIKRYADEMPELYPLAVVFKQLLRERDLNDAYTGGLSSYSVVLMIIHFQLLWRYGDKCFKAAAAFASGSPLPRPADLLAEEEREAARALAESANSTPWGKKQALEADTLAPTPTPTPTVTSSFAAVVSRSKSLKRPVSEAGRSASTPTDAAKAGLAQPFSYAAVAAGIAKLASTSEDANKSSSAPPTSYAAAVAAPPSKAKTPTPTPRATSTAKTANESMDAVSVTSSTADTEESSAHGDADDDVANAPAAEPQLSLGERTMTILEFYGIVFDFRMNGLSVRDGGYIYRLADQGDLGKRLPSLVIEDPIHPDRNVSASSFAFSKVVAVFEDAFYALKFFRSTRFTPSALSCLLSTSGHTLVHQSTTTKPLAVKVASS